MAWLVDTFRKNEGIDLSSDRQAMQRLTEAAEKAKIELSTMVQTNINLPFITADASGAKHMDVTLTRADFEQMTSDLTDRLVEPVKKALADANIDTASSMKSLWSAVHAHARRAGAGEETHRQSAAQPIGEPGRSRRRRRRHSGGRALG